MTGKAVRQQKSDWQVGIWPLEERPGFLIRRLHQIHVALFQMKCAAFDVTPLQYSLLTALAQCGTADQTTLAAEVMLDRTTTTGALKRLQSRKFIERTVDRRDRRAQMCRLTKSGQRLLRRIEAPARAAHHETLQGLSKTEQRQLIAMMRKVVSRRARQEDTALAPD